MGRPGRVGASRVLLAVVTLVAVGLVALSTGRTEAPPPRATDPLEARILGEVDGFLDWLDTHDAKGVLGEVSWPSDDPDGRWSALARKWLARAEASETPAAYWAAGEVWNDEDVPYLAFAASGGSGAPVDTVLPPGEVLAEVGDLGLNSAGGSYNACSREPTCDTFHNRKRGRMGREWQFDSQASFDLYAAQGISWVRIPIRWERLQPDLNEPLDTEVAGELEAVIDRAHRAGLDVVVDLHNFGAYYEFDGSTGVRRALGDDLDADALIDVWRRIVDRLGDHPAIRGWGIMNEPVDMGDDGLRQWEEISQRVVTDLRERGDDNPLLVGGYELSNVHSWPHAEPWIDDPLDRTRYEAHHHWDRHHGATYASSYAEEQRSAAGG